jgi:flagellar protein FlbD
MGEEPGDIADNCTIRNLARPTGSGACQLVHRFGTKESSRTMITLTRLNGEEVIVNGDLIELIEKTPDTVLTLTTGRKLMVRETTDQVIKSVLDFRHIAGPILAKAIPATHVQHFGEQARIDHDHNEAERSLSQSGRFDN